MRIFKAAITNIRSNKQLFFASVGTITIALSILGLFLFVYINLNSILSFWNNQVQLIVYLDDNIPSRHKKKIEETISSHSEVESFSYVSREQAWKDFQTMFSDKSAFLKGMGFNPLPASYNLKIKPSLNRLDYIQGLADQLGQQAGVESVEYGEEWIRRFEAFIILMRVFLFALGGLLSMGAILIISNTVKLSILSRKDEIELMLLIGGTPGFIKLPFILEGMFHGLVGALVSLGLMKGVHFYLISQLPATFESFGKSLNFQFLSFSLVAIIISTSIVVGWLGSIFSLRQFLEPYKKL